MMSPPRRKQEELARVAFHTIARSSVWYSSFWQGTATASAASTPTGPSSSGASTGPGTGARFAIACESDKELV